MQHLLEKLYQAHPLNQQESLALFSRVMTGELNATQLAGALVAMKVRGEQPEEIAGAAAALLANAKPFPRPDYLFADIAGTGGDGSNSINISTASAFVAAACGLKIAKHGNRSVSSQSGSSDLLHACGVNLHLSAEQSRQALDELNICFLFAPAYHAGFQHAIPIRQQLKTRTLFNLLGPLTNPAHPPLMMVGVSSPSLIMPIAAVLQIMRYQRALVVYGDGLDEVTLHSETQVAELRDGNLTRYTLTAADFGCHPWSKTALKGGSPAENSVLIRRLLQGEGLPAHEETVAANVAMLLKLFGHEDLRENTQHALDVIRSGQADELLIALAGRG